jgi:prepilin-type N-terminal cleavage/methylation domain-containing protein
MTPYHPRTNGRRAAGFTLMELMVVIVIIAILATIIMGSATYVMRMVREKRATVLCRVLETALTRYRHDYGEWPIGNRKPEKKNPDDDELVNLTGADNAIAFGPLRERNNPKNIRYLDESGVYTLDEAGQPVPLSRAGTGDKPLLYARRRDAGMSYFTVKFNMDADSVTVEAPEAKKDE